MDKLSQARLEIALRWKPFDDQLMQVSSRVNTGSWINHLPDHDFGSIISHDLALPGQIEIRFAGKQQGEHTRVDDQGQIVEDMAVIIESVSLDGFQANHNLLHRKLVLTTETGERIVSHFVGFNGTMHLALAKSHVLGVLMDWNSDQIDL